MWFISFGQWDLGPLLEKNETKVELDTYVEQLHYRFRQSQEGPENENGTTVGWAMVVNMDGFTLGKAFDYNGTHEIWHAWWRKVILNPDLQ